MSHPHCCASLHESLGLCIAAVSIELVVVRVVKPRFEPAGGDGRIHERAQDNSKRLGNLTLSNCVEAAIPTPAVDDFYDTPSFPF